MELVVNEQNVQGTHRRRLVSMASARIIMLIALNSCNELDTLTGKCIKVVA